MDLRVFKKIFLLTFLLFGCTAPREEQIFSTRLVLLVSDPMKVDQELFEFGTRLLEDEAYEQCKEAGYSSFKLQPETQKCWWRDDGLEAGQRAIMFSCEAKGICKDR